MFYSWGYRLAPTVAPARAEALETILDREKNDLPGPAISVEQLAELLQYQEGAIVSRVLLKNKGGTVTVFAFDEGSGLSEHTAPFDALVIGVDGEANISIDGTSFRVVKGETITLPANRPHAVKALTKFKMALIMIRA